MFALSDSELQILHALWILIQTESTAPIVFPEADAGEISASTVQKPDGPATTQQKISPSRKFSKRI